MTCFPMFISLEKKPCLVVGAGRVARRKTEGLKAFGAEVTVVAKELNHGLNRADLEQKQWALVVAATDDRQVNHHIWEYCHAKGIPVNVADCKEECSFFFPAWCREDNVAAGITTSGVSPALAKFLRGKLEKILPEWIREFGAL